MLKTLAEVEAKLRERYAGPTEKKNGFTYIPWHVTARLLDEVFGRFGWTTSQPVVIFVEGVYTATLAITVRVMDDASGEIIEKTVPGVGSAVARGQQDDNASKSALSDAISRAAKLLGDAFGFYLYEEKETPATIGPQRQTNTTAPRASTTSGTAGSDRGPSEKQRKILTDKLHYSEEQINAMAFAEWKGALDGYFAELKGGF